MNDLQTANSRYLELLMGTLTDTIFAPEPDLEEPDYAVDTWFDCRAAVDEFRSARGILPPLEFGDTHCCSWGKPWPEVEEGGFTPPPGNGAA